MVFFNSANLDKVYFIKLGSFLTPLIGMGAKKGLSVSMSNLFKGIVLNVFCKSIVFLNVIMPLAEKKAPNDNSF